jgi:hypothetical protein
VGSEGGIWDRPALLGDPMAVAAGPRGYLQNHRALIKRFVNHERFEEIKDDNIKHMQQSHKRRSGKNMR